jgi:Capsule assembly protein Wzi
MKTRPAAALSLRTIVVCAFFVFGAVLVEAQPAPVSVESESSPQTVAPAATCQISSMGSPYIPVDSWVYPAVLRLYSLGYVDTVFLGLRPWTRTSVARMLEESSARIDDDEGTPAGDQAQEIYEALMHELRFDIAGPCMTWRGQARVESIYTVIRGISGTPLRDSYHMGSSIVNDYGRLYQSGVNTYTGASGYWTAGRFFLYVRGEFGSAPSATGYSTALAQTLAEIDGTYGQQTGFVYYNQATIPMGPISSTFRGRIQEATLGLNVLNHQISFGKHDQWLGPGLGGSFAYSNNAENIYGFQINRVEPLRIPLLSRLTGPFRYEFLVGQLRGHTFIPNVNYTGNPAVQPNVTAPGNPWMHVEKVSFRPTENLEFGFERTVIWGGKGHVPITVHSFLKSFFSLQNVTAEEKNGRDDPGARFGQFDFSYRLPWVRKWLTLYTDGEVHDDVSPIDAPRRAAWRPGLYLSHMPGVPRLDLRTEGVYTDLPVGSSQFGRFMYFEAIQRQGYTNQGQIFGDWIGREAKGGQAWLTYHLSGNEWLQASYRRQKVAKDFIAIPNSTQYGTTLDDFGFQAVKRLGKDFEVNGSFTVEHYLAPMYLTNKQTVTTTNIQLTWYPSWRTTF